VADVISTLVDLLGKRARNQSDSTAYTFLQDGEIEAGQLTYKELDFKARAIAAQLQSLNSIGVTLGWKPKVLLLYPASLEYIAAFFGCLYAGVVAVPTYPPRPNRSLFRLQAIVEDAQATVALTTASVLSNVEHQLAQFPALKALHWVATDNIAREMAHKCQEPEVNSDTLAFFQYTSGSTGSPKGVMVSHGNLLHNLAGIDLKLEHTPNSVMVTWLPIFHDMGLVYGVLQPFYQGFPCYIMAPTSFVQRPIRWLEAISRYRATHSAAPNFAYELCVRKTTPEQRESLNLSSWCMASNGAEPVREETLERFAAAFKPAGFVPSSFCPGYGLAEGTLAVSAVQKTDMPVFCKVQADALEQNRVIEATDHQQKVKTLVGCGRPVLDTEIAIVHPESLLRCPSDEVGEIWVLGSSVTQGYWMRPAETASTFRAFLKDTGEGPFLRTGDLGFLKDGELFITGRRKDLIIIWGRNYYPQDIELTVEESHPALRAGCGAAFSVEVEGEEQLVVAQEVERTISVPSRDSYSENRYNLRNLDVDEVVGAIRKAVSEQHELQVYAVLLLKTGSIPKTSSGKIQRHAARAGFLAESLSVVGKSILKKSEFAIQNSELWFQAKKIPNLIDQIALLLGIAPSQLNPQQPLISLGIDSLKAVEIKNYIEANFGLVLPMEKFLEDISITQLASWILSDTKLSSLKQQPVLDSTTQSNPAIKNGMQFSLFYFSSNEAEFTDDKYQLLIEGAKFADKNGFVAVWIPERHFHAFGGIYPNPSVLASALAMVTDRIRLRAGSVVLPLHNPIRVAEEWSVVDNLSRGRVDIAFARGWNPNDFVLSKETYANRTKVMFSGIRTLHKLWQGESIFLPNGLGKETGIKIHPLPKQRELPVWITCSGDKERFIEAGAFGANILTALLFQPIEELAEKIALYRETRSIHGHAPEAGHVTLMLHTFVGEDMAIVRNKVREPFTEYLKNSVDLWRHGAKSLDDLNEKEREDLLTYAFERYFQTSALFGTSDDCLKLVARLKEIGVDEIASLIDFGVNVDSVMAALYSLKRLKDDSNFGINPDTRQQDKHQHNQANTIDRIDQEKAKQLLVKIDQLSDQEVNSLLSELLAVEEVGK